MRTPASEWCRWESAFYNITIMDRKGKFRKVFLSTNCRVLFFLAHLASYLTSYLAFYNVSLHQVCRPVGGSSPTFILWVAHSHSCFHERHHLELPLCRVEHHHHHLGGADPFYGEFSQSTKSGEPASLYWPSCIISPLHHFSNTFFTNNFHLVRCLAFQYTACFALTLQWL